MGDCGLTGRKIIVDTYGGMARHGGGAFSGKDPSKVDRSAAYAARYVAKNVVAAGLADRARGPGGLRDRGRPPVSVMVECFGTEKVGRSRSSDLIRRALRPAPGAFRQNLKLHRPIYQKTLPTATLAGRTITTSPGSGRTRPRRSARPPAWGLPSGGFGAAIAA